MREKTGRPHKFFTSEYRPNDPEIRRFADEWHDYLAVKYSDQQDAVNYALKVDGQVMQKLVNGENVLMKYNEITHELLKELTKLLKEACEYYGIDPAKEKYYVHSWLNYARGPRNINQNDIALDDHGAFPTKFHGYYAINAEPSITYYELDEDNPDHPMGLWPWHNKNGTMLLSLNGYDHGIGDWESTEPRITLAYNLTPLNLISTEEDMAYQIPIIL